ncbi:hypothetical protein V1264_010973 [Littorina saxatilis]|uniref:Uncharacterized protein n=2 Tax=Littorina saxatilis TaxID=31220 RepID=A0AAN9GJY7_9CAEN
MIPLNAIGREYVVGSIYVTDVATLLKIVPLQAGDQFLYNNVSYTATRDRQVFEFESNITEIVHILADIPVFVGQLTGCTTAGNNPDLTMTLPVPVDHWETSYQMYVSSNEITSSNRNETFLCLLVPLGVEITVLGSDSQATVSQMTQEDYVLLTVEVMTDGLVTVRCVNSTNCQPFTGYMLHNMRARSSAFAMRKTLMTEDMTTSGMSSTSVGSSGTPLTSSEPTTPFTITSLSTESRAATNSTVWLTGDTTHTDVPTLSSDATTTEMSSGSVQDATTTRGLVSSDEATSTNTASTLSETSAAIDDASFSTVGDTKGTSNAYSPFSTASSRTDDLSSSVADIEETSNVHSPLSTASSRTENVSSSVANTEGISNAYSPFSTASSSTENVPSSVADSGVTTNVYSPSTADTTSVTNPHSQTATNLLCRCRCGQKKVNKDLANRTEAIIADLTTDKKQLSSYIRSKTSALDRRMSSAVLGASVGIVSFVVVFGFILVLDVGAFVRKWTDRKQH